MICQSLTAKSDKIQHILKRENKTQSLNNNMNNIQQTIKNYEASKKGRRDFPGGPVANSMLPVQGAQVRSLVWELDPTYHN